MSFNSLGARAGSCVRIAGLAVLAVLTVSHSALANVMVLQSTAPGLKAGATLSPDQSIKIPSGKTAVLMLPNGATKTLSGPFDAKAQTLTQGLQRNAALWNSVKDYVRTGGSKSNKVGATRGLAPAAGPTLAGESGWSGGFSWTRIPVTAKGDVCVHSGSEILFVRSQARAPLKVTMVEMQRSLRAVLSFEAGARVAAWPKTFQPGVKRYALLAPNQPMSQIQLRMIDQLPDDENILRVLFGQRCLAQVAAYVRGLRD